MELYHGQCTIQQRLTGTGAQRLSRYKVYYDTHLQELSKKNVA